MPERRDTSADFRRAALEANPDAMRAGDVPTWSSPLRFNTSEQMAEALRTFADSDLPVPTVDDPNVRAAVLVLLVGSANDGWSVVLTRRASTMRAQPDHVSFPGGRRDPDDATLIDTAFREAEEEIGLDRSCVQILGRLSAQFGPQNEKWLQPIIGVTDVVPVLVANPHEVADILVVPLAELVEPGTHRVEHWRLARFNLEEIEMHAFDLPTDTVWGATARVLADVLKLAIVARD